MQTYISRRYDTCMNYVKITDNYDYDADDDTDVHVPYDRLVWGGLSDLQNHAQDETLLNYILPRDDPDVYPDGDVEFITDRDLEHLWGTSADILHCWDSDCGWFTDHGTFEKGDTRNFIDLKFTTKDSPPIECYRELERCGFSVVARYHIDCGYDGKLGSYRDGRWKHVNLESQSQEWYETMINASHWQPTP